MNIVFIANETLLKTKVVPNIIPRGYWQGFWFRVPPNPIEFGYEGSENAIFSWTQINSYFANISANFLSITSLYGQSVGLNFPCSCMYTLDEDYLFYSIALY